MEIDDVLFHSPDGATIERICHCMVMQSVNHNQSPTAVFLSRMIRHQLVDLTSNSSINTVSFVW